MNMQTINLLLLFKTFISNSPPAEKTKMVYENNDTMIYENGDTMIYE